MSQLQSRVIGRSEILHRLRRARRGTAAGSCPGGADCAATASSSFAPAAVRCDAAPAIAFHAPSATASVSAAPICFDCTSCAAVDSRARYATAPANLGEVAGWQDRHCHSCTAGSRGRELVRIQEVRRETAASHGRGANGSSGCLCSRHDCGKCADCAAGTSYGFGSRREFKRSACSERSGIASSAEAESGPSAATTGSADAAKNKRACAGDSGSASLVIGSAHMDWIAGQAHSCNPRQRKRKQRKTARRLAWNPGVDRG